jgi:hypothetical protein
MIHTVILQTQPNAVQQLVWRVWIAKATTGKGEASFEDKCFKYIG